ncbi:chaperonin 10-like protein [Microdochium trichocladiopsis]|uniref:Chaperonin 10-like protein n=1 Tax=Microdochium trichocladiopsis TaxID=1682393 RepID=A0A9P9BQ71_9PEZI|nr:chaperonin 10-like protein [Microdochium trichocladiopsis]KAH7029920.1 chaperonin 10-like protein [Microdochium trichocladiopsis]
MAESINTALYMDRDCQMTVRRDFNIPKPQADEVLIEVEFSGVNPADIRHGTQLGVVPAVLGYDFSGRVVSGPSGSGLSPGNAVAGMTPTGVGRPARYGAHQKFLACPVDWLFRVPTALMPMPDAACLSVVASTAADVMFNIFSFPLPSQSPNQSEGNSKGGPLLIWGGSTAVGCCTIQFARACGVKPIFVTASPARHELLKSLGATLCFDYRDPDVIAKILAAVEAQQQGPVRYALDAAGSFGASDGGPSSFEQMVSCCPANARLSSVTSQDPRSSFPLATRARDVVLAIPGLPRPMTFPADQAKSAKITAGLHWAVENYGKGFLLPAIRTWSGKAEDALDELRNVDAQGTFGKLAIQHPLQ